MTPKEKQKQLLIEIMEADAKDGLYKQQTAVEWLIEWVNTNQYVISNELLEVFEKAKQMEKEQSIELIKQTAMFMSVVGLDKDVAKMDFEDVYNSYYNKTLKPQGV